MKYLLLIVLFFANLAYTTNDAIDSWLAEIFPIKEIHYSPLFGGLSNTSLYKLEVQGKEYVLRVHKKPTSQDKLEHFALMEAAKKHIAPPIIAVAPDHSAIIMEFINGKTLSLEDAKNTTCLDKIAYALQCAHQIKGHDIEGETLLSKAERSAKKVLQDGIGEVKDIHRALELVKQYRETLSTYSFDEVYVHGDLNPRNIFKQDTQILFIDWAETHPEDPFYDLAYFALKHDYDVSLELSLLEKYLERIPTKEERERFQLQKKMHQAFWSLTNLYLAFVELTKKPNEMIDKQAPLKSWSYYQQKYAENCTLNAQYFYELSRLNLQMAEDDG